METHVAYRLSHFDPRFRRNGDDEVELMGTGPYCFDSFEEANGTEMEQVLWRMIDKHNCDHSVWPPITDDLLTDDLRKWRLGKANGGVKAYYTCCPTLETLMDWFEDDIEDLILHGFRVTRYECVHALYTPSNTQCAVPPWAVVKSEDVTHEVEKLTLI